MGDPAGIGPQIIVKALQDSSLIECATYVVYGANEVLTITADHCNIQPKWFRVNANSTRVMTAISKPFVVLDDTEEGVLTLSHAPSALGGLVSKRWVETALKDSLRSPNDPRHIDAIVTAPISKQSWTLAGYKWPGHTELIASRTRAKRVAMMFVSQQSRVVLATCHLPLMDIRNVLTIGKVFDAIDLAALGCQQLGIRNPRIGVAGLNPHAGEGGMFGDEESRLIKPAIKVARNNGLDVEGPFAADTLFCAIDSYDVIVAMYHDQGLLPMKLLYPHASVNYTLGVPIIRTSPDHGTAFDIAHTTSANPNSMMHAIELACQLTSTAVGHPC